MFASNDTQYLAGAASPAGPEETTEVQSEPNREGEVMYYRENYSNRHEDGWRETDNGNYVLIEGGDLVATVFSKDGESWGAVWNGAADGKPRFLKARCDSAEEAQALLEDAIEGGDEARWWPIDNQWTLSKKGDPYRRVEGAGAITVKRAKSGSFFACGADGLLRQGGKPMWFPTAAAARAAVDRYAAGVSGMSFG
jgi:hypothetical protein